MTKLILALLLTVSTANAATTRVIEAENTEKFFSVENKLKNAGYEPGKGKFGWTASGGTFALTTTAANIGRGSQAASWDSSAAAQTLTASSVAITSGDGLSGKNGAASCSMKCASGTCTHKIQAYDGANVLAETSAVTTTTGFVRTSINFPFPASGTAALRIISVAADEPILYADDCYLGLAEGFNLMAGSVDTTAIAYTPTFTGFGIVTAINFTYARKGDAVEIQGTWTAGTSTATEARISLPSGLVASSTYPAIQFVGYAHRSQTATNQMGMLIEPSATYLTIDAQGAGAGLAKVDGVDTLSTGQTASLFARVRIQGWTAETSFRPDTVASSWSGYHSNDCGFSNTGATYDDPAADATCTFTERTNTSMGTVTSYLSGSDKLPGIVFTPSAAHKWKVCARVLAYATNLNDYYNFKLWDGTNTIAEVEDTEETATSVNSSDVCGFINLSAGASKTISIQSKVSNNTVSIATTNAPVIEWSIFAIDQSLPAPLLTGSVTSNSSGLERSERVRVNTTCTTSPCTIASQSGSWISSITRNSAGNYTANIAAGIFSAAPDCSMTLGNDTDNFAGVVNSTITSTAVTTFCRADTSGASIDCAFTIKCQGPR